MNSAAVTACKNSIRQEEENNKGLIQLFYRKQGGKLMSDQERQEKKESARRTTESFVRKTEIEKAFILGYMVKRTQLKGLTEPEFVMTELP